VSGPIETLTVDSTDREIAEAVALFLTTLERVPPYKMAIRFNAKKDRAPIKCEWVALEYCGIETRDVMHARGWVVAALLKGLTVCRVFGRERSDENSIADARHDLQRAEVMRNRPLLDYDDDEIPF
jgi:hypothetical protein